MTTTTAAAPRLLVSSKSLRMKTFLPCGYISLDGWFSLGKNLQGSLYYQPKQCTAIREILENYHRFVLFDSPKMGPPLPDGVLPIFL